MIAVLVATAFAHPFGAHQAVHHTRWEVGPELTRLRYTIDVPDAYLRGRPDPYGAMQTELLSGLRLAVDGTATSLELVGASHGPPAHTVRFELELTARHPVGVQELVLSDGNLPLTPALCRTDVLLDPDVQLVDSSLLVRHEGRVVRSDSGRIRAGDSHRTVRLRVRRDDGPFARLHRWAQQGSGAPRSELASLPPTARQVLTTNRTTPGVALVAVIGLSLAGGLTRTSPSAPGRWPWLVVLVVPLELFLHATEAAAPLAAAAALAALLTLRRPEAWWWVAPALAASLDLRGAALGVAVLQALLASCPSPQAPPRWAVGVASLAALAQAARSLS